MGLRGMQRHSHNLQNNIDPSKMPTRAQKTGPGSIGTSQTCARPWAITSTRARSTELANTDLSSDIERLSIDSAENDPGLRKIPAATK